MHRGKWLFIQVFKMKKFLVLIYLVLYIALSCALFIPVVPLGLVCLLCNKEIAWLNSYRFWWGRLYYTEYIHNTTKQVGIASDLFSGVMDVFGIVS